MHVYMYIHTAVHTATAVASPTLDAPRADPKPPRGDGAADMGA